MALPKLLLAPQEVRHNADFNGDSIHVTIIRPEQYDTLQVYDDEQNLWEASGIEVYDVYTLNGLHVYTSSWLLVHDILRVAASGRHGLQDVLRGDENHGPTRLQDYIQRRTAVLSQPSAASAPSLPAIADLFDDDDI